MPELNISCFFREDYIVIFNSQKTEEERFLISELKKIIENIQTHFFEEIYVIYSKNGNCKICVDFWKDDLDMWGEYCPSNYTLETVYLSKRDFDKEGISKVIRRLEKKLKKYDFWKRHESDY